MTIVMKGAYESGLREECGLFGMSAPRSGDLARYAYFGLYALQHRGQEAAGIAAQLDDGRIRVSKRRGLVAQAVRSADLAQLTPARAVIGHVRYGTSGGEDVPENRQPLVMKLHSGQVALAHNGTLVNARSLTDELERDGAIFRTSMDSELFAHLLARANGRPFEDALRFACERVEGAFSLLVMHGGVLYAVRDPHGFRPLWLGRLGEAVVAASETCAFDLLGADPFHELAPGELAVITAESCVVKPFLEPRRASPCVFELIYLARPDSRVFGRSVYEFRTRCGERLAAEADGEAGPDAVVVPIPDSGMPAALGYARRAGLPFEVGLIRNHYVGRTFIQPFQEIRNLRLKIKLNPVRHLFAGRDVVLVDDSLVRGTTCRRIVELVRDCGARRVHVAIAAPPIRHACHYGIDTPDTSKLVAATMDEDDIRAFLGADTLRYLSFDGLATVFGEGGFCSACFDGDYPVEVAPRDRQEREG